LITYNRRRFFCDIITCDGFTCDSFFYNSFLGNSFFCSSLLDWSFFAGITIGFFSNSLLGCFFNWLWFFRLRITHKTLTLRFCAHTVGLLIDNR
jgi:hypothetical protein